MSADFMSHPDRNCRPPSDKPIDIQLHSDMWFPPDGGEREAMKLCRGCPVEARCAEWAIPQADLVGIFGGYTTEMRRRARLNLASAA